MSPAPLLSIVADLCARLGVDPGDLDAADTARARAALDDAATLAVAEVPASVAEHWLTSAPDAARVVVLKAARR